MNYSCEALIATCLFVAGCGGGGAVGSVVINIKLDDREVQRLPIVRRGLEIPVP